MRIQEEPRSLYLIGLSPSSSAPASIMRARSGPLGPGEFLVALPCLIVLAILEEKPARLSLARVAQLLSGGFIAQAPASLLEGSCLSLEPASRLEEARGFFPPSASPWPIPPGIALRAGFRQRPGFESSDTRPIPLRNLLLELYKLEAGGIGWEEGLSWECLASRRLKKTGR